MKQQEPNSQWRNLRLKNHKLEFEFNELSKRYVRSSDVDAAMESIHARAASVLLPGAELLAPQVVPVTIPVAERIIRDWLNDGLTQLHRQPFSKPGEPKGQQTE